MSLTADAPPRAMVPDYTSIEVAGDLLCSYCFQPKHAQRPLKACSACRRVSYCSPVCQKKDWKIRHKLFCPRFQKLNEYDKGLGDKGFSLLELDMRKHERIRILQSDNRDQYEPCADCCLNIIKSEIVCEVCNKSPYQRPQYRAFESCVCGIARYCSDACKAKLSSVHSSEDCSTLRLLGATERVQIDYHLNRRKAYALEHMMAPSPSPRRKYVPLSQYTGWEHYHRELAREFSDSPRIMDMYQALARSFPCSHPMAAQGVGQMATEAESIPFTVIAGLEASVPDNNITSRTSIEIHIIAAASRELSTKAMMEEVLHHFSRLRNLRLCYVGPEVAAEDRSTVNQACAPCKSLGSTRAWSLHQMEYHVFLQSNPDRKADFVVGLNTGWSEVATGSWIPTLNAILSLKVPALFTTYSLNEAQREDRMFQDMGAHFVVPVHANKWRGVIPIVNKGIRMQHDTLAVYTSAFSYVIRGRK